MFNFDKTDIQRFAVSSVGAIALSAASFAAAAGPAKAATLNAPLTVADWQSQVAHKIEAAQEPVNAYQPGKLTKSEVAVFFTSDGNYSGVTLADSSGDRKLDDRAIAVARHIAYPALPEGFRNMSAIVTMKLYFGQGEQAAADYAALRQRAEQNVQLARADTGNGMQVAAR